MPARRPPFQGRSETLHRVDSFGQLLNFERASSQTCRANAAACLFPASIIDRAAIPGVFDGKRYNAAETTP